MKFALFFSLFLKILYTECTHIKGTWNTGDFFMILLKFGFVKTDPHDPSSTGYVYGNITTDVSKFYNKYGTFVLIDYDQFSGYYRTYRYKVLENKEKACQQMFAQFDFGKCDSDYLKRVSFISEVPCSKNQVCLNASNPAVYVHGSQFTFQINELQSPR